MTDLSLLALNQAITRNQWGLRQAVEGYSRAGVKAISVWSNKVAECGVAEAKTLLSDNGMSVPGYCLAEAPGVLTPERMAQLADITRRALDEAAVLRAECLVMMLGSVSGPDDTLAEARRRAAEFISRILPHARSLGVAFGIEPVHPMRAGDMNCVNTLRQAKLISDQVGEGAGIVVDTYHVWWDPDLAEGIAAVSGRIVSFQVSDWLKETIYTGNDRGMPGDGLIDIAGIWRMVRKAGYLGPCEIELMSERDWWTRDPEEVVRVCVDRFGEILKGLDRA